jgi:hypothetical protein
MILTFCDLKSLFNSFLTCSRLKEFSFVLDYSFFIEEKLKEYYSKISIDERNERIIYCKNIMSFRALLDLGASAYKIDFLKRIIDEERLEFIEELIKRKFDFNVWSWYEGSPYQFAVTRHKEKVVQMLLEAYPQLDKN